MRRGGSNLTLHPPWVDLPGRRAEEIQFDELKGSPSRTGLPARRAERAFLEGEFPRNPPGSNWLARARRVVKDPPALLYIYRSEGLTRTGYLIFGRDGPGVWPDGRVVGTSPPPLSPSLGNSGLKQF